MYPELLMMSVTVIIAIAGLCYVVYRVKLGRKPLSYGKITMAERLAQNHPCIKTRIKHALDANGGFLTNNDYTDIQKWCNDMDVAQQYDLLYKSIARKATT